jgi:hypothetical protein
MSTLVCSQCGRSAPTDPEELRSWKHGDLVIAGELDEVTATMLLCPECVQEDLAHEYEEGEPG